MPDVALLDPDDPVGWTPAQRRMIRAVRSGSPVVDRDRLRAALGRIAWPVAYVDFEFEPGMAIPRFEGTRPYQKLPFQWSMHVQEAPGAELELRSPFLWLDAGDSREVFIESLLAALPQEGSIVAHYVSAEWSVLGQYERWFGGRYWPDVQALERRFVDTHRIAKDCLHHPGQQGSFSIKRLAPALLGRGYGDLEIQDGMGAVREWRRVVAREVEGAELERVRGELLAYCGRDTELLHGLVGAMRELCG